MGKGREGGAQKPRRLQKALGELAPRGLGGPDRQGARAPGRSSWKFGARRSTGPISTLKTTLRQRIRGTLSGRQCQNRSSVPGSPYVGPPPPPRPNSTHQPPLPRGSGFQNAPAHGPTQQPPRPAEARRRAACCSHPETAPPPTSPPLDQSWSPPAASVQSWAGHGVATPLRGGSGGAVAVPGRPAHSAGRRHRVPTGCVVGLAEPLLDLRVWRRELCSGPAAVLPRCRSSLPG